jgi:transglutaminase-like putative cysteine protease
MRIRNCWFFSLLVLAFSAQAADKFAGNITDLVRWSPVKQRHNYQEYLPQPEKVAAFEKLGYGSVTLEESHQISLKTDKVVEETVSTAQLYLSSNGIENAGNSGFWIDTLNQRVEIQGAYVLQADGGLIDVDPGTLQITSDNSAYIFNDYSYVTVPFSQLKPGSIAILVYKTVSYHDKLPLPWARVLYPANFVHIEHFQVQINWADTNQKPVWQTDYANLECQESRLSLDCSTKQPNPPLPTDRNMPSAYDVLPVLVFAESTSWAAISNSMQTLTEPALSKSEKIKDLAAHLIKDVTRPEEKLSRLSTFVSREIRYVGIEHGNQGVIPRPTLTTLERRFGDCKDKTMLFVDLARQAGLDAYPVLTSSKRLALSKLLLPAANYFNHMIACVKLSPYQEACVDLTDPGTSAEHLPYSLHGAVSLTVGRGTDTPRNLATEPYIWITEVKANNRLTDDGAIVETLERNYNSHWAAGLRHALASKSQAERERWLLEDYRSVMTDKVTPSVQLQGLDQPQSLVVMTSTTEFSKAFNPTELTSFSEIDPWLRDLAKNSKTTNSHYPFAFQGLNYHSQLSYQLNQGKRIGNLGPEIDYVSPWGSFHRYYRKDETSITAYTELKMPRAAIPVEKVAEFNRFLDLSSQETRIWFSVQQVLDDSR